jgi:shikimate dehydrogenase
MHAAALSEMGLGADWAYEAIAVSPDDFEGLVRSLPAKGFAGVNVTVPHKVAALAIADAASRAAAEIGAANTLTFKQRRIQADNTDAGAIIAALPVPPQGKKALVLGAGGSARAAVWALREAGADVNVWNRTPSKAQAIATEFEVGLDTEGPRIVVNATTVGLVPANQGQPLGQSETPDLKAMPVFDDGFKAEVVLDLVYGSLETELIARAREAGAIAVDGLEVLVHQGAASFRIWTGLDPPLETMRRAARGAS